MVSWKEKQWKVEQVCIKEGAVQKFAATELSSGEEVFLYALSIRNMAGNWQELDAFQNRAKLYKGMRIPGVPEFVNQFEGDEDSDKVYYLVTSRPSGVKPLSEVLADGWRPTEEEMVELASQVLEGHCLLHWTALEPLPAQKKSQYLTDTFLNEHFQPRWNPATIYIAWVQSCCGSCREKALQIASAEPAPRRIA